MITKFQQVSQKKIKDSDEKQPMNFFRQLVPDLLPTVRSAGGLVIAKGDGREVGFQDGGYFSKFLKRERIKNQTFIAFLNCG